MRRILISLLLVGLIVPTLYARNDILLDPDYDPRIEMRVVVLPALKDRSLRRVSERTISALFATELLRRYEVLDLLRFEQYLADRDLTLADALSAEAEPIVRDTANVDAIASVEIYRWDQGTTGLPFLGRQSGKIGARVRIMDPYSGRIYWSVNRLEKVKPGTEFLDRATNLFRDILDDLDHQLTMVAQNLNEMEEYEMLLAEGDMPRLESRGERKYTSDLKREQGYIPKQASQVVPKRRGPLPTVKPTEETLASRPTADNRELLPPLFADDADYEDVEKIEPVTRQTTSRKTTTAPAGRQATPSGPPPIPQRFQAESPTLPPVELLNVTNKEELPATNQDSYEEEEN